MSASTLKTYSTFVKGLITEAGPLTFPENSAADIENIVLNREGSLQRRLGMNYEEGFVLQDVDLTSTDAVTVHRWKNAAGSVENHFALVQVGSQLLIFDATEDSVSGNLLQTFDLSPELSGLTPIQVVSGLGYAFIFGCQGADFLYMEYNQGTGAFTVQSVVMKVRDFWGLDDGLTVDNQPASLSTAHNYNLRNQGWPSAKITAYHSSEATYPSNAQQWFLGRKDDNTFDPNQLQEMEFGTTPAPKGHFVIWPFLRHTSRDNESGLTTPTDAEDSRPTTGAFAFQRLFVAGLQSTTPLDTPTSPNMTGIVFYSRVIRNTRDFGQYHSDADPTSEVDSELVDTDGGYIIIPDSGKIHRLVSKGNSILILAEEGVWALQGDEGGFRATSQQVKKISSFGVLAPAAVVDTEESLFYWNKGGIYLMGIDPNTGEIAASNVTENSIQTMYNSLDLATKQNAVGTYDPVNRKVMWMYNDDFENYTGAEFKQRYNREIVLDLALEAWYKNSISSIDEPSPYIAGYLTTPDFLLRQEGVRNRGDSVTKYLVIQFIDEDADEASVSFSYYRDEALKDWRSSDTVGVDYESFIVCGYEILGDTTRNKQAPYVFVHCKRTELEGVDDGDGNAVPDNPSSLTMQQRWDWSSSGNSGKWGEPQQVYRLNRPYIIEIGEPIDYGHDVITTKNRVTGTGKALSLVFRSVEDKDFYIYGWAVRFSGTSHV